MYWIFIILGALFLACFGGALYAYHEAFYCRMKGRDELPLMPVGKQYDEKKKEISSLLDEISSRPFEPVYIKSFDGTTLFARYYRVKDGAPVQIQFHGYRSPALTNFCGGIVTATKLGFNALVVDQRGIGKSGGYTTTFGIKESLDCIEWIKYVINTFGEDTKIVISGVSMGASTVIMAAGKELPKNVVGVTADCPYSSAKEIIKMVCKKQKMPAELLYPFIWLGARIFGGFNLSEGDVTEAVKRAKIPILFVHGADDRFVPCEMSKELFEKCTSKKRLEIFEGAGHGLCYVIDTARYEKMAIEFLSECFSKDI